MRAIVVATLSVTLAVRASAQCSPAIMKLVADQNHDVARKDVAALLRTNPNDDAAMHCMGRIAMEQNKSNDAVDWFEKAVKANDRSADHHLWLGNALGQEAQKASKIRQPILARRVKSEFERTVALDPTSIDAHHGLVQFYSLAPGIMGGSKDKAREHATEIGKLNSMRGHIEIGSILQREKDLAGAEREYVAALAGAPDSTVAYSVLGSFYQNQKKWTEAFDVFDRMIKARPDEIVARFLYGRVAAVSGQNLERGEREMKSWLAGIPKDSPVASQSAGHLRLGMIYEHQGKSAAARAEYQTALSLNPKNEDAKAALAKLK